MGKVLAGVVTCGLVAAVVLIGAAPSGAQDPLWPGDAVQLDSELLPDPDALPGEPLTVRPIENCTMEGDGPGVLFWRWQIGIEYPGETIRGVHGDEGEVPLGEDGSWEVSFPASTFSTFAGENPFVFVAFCLPNGRAGHAEEVDACFPSGEVDEVALTGEEPPFDCLFEVYGVDFTVTNSGPSVTSPTVPPGTGTPPPSAAPATPVVATPSVIG
jgi:hypothetical protein